MSEHELVIRGGTVVDGTGGAPRPADVALRGGRIAFVGEVEGRGRREVDAQGLLVTPGWVDVHTHYDGQVTWDPFLTPSSWHGVTTAVMGNCGVGFAPVRPDRHGWLIALMEGVEDIPGTALHEGISWGWESFPQYLDVLERLPLAIDVAAQVPHAALRGYVMGDRGADHTAVCTPEEIAEMGRLAAEAIGAGALGFTTSRTVAHRSVDGRPTPTLTATADELLGIASAIGATGRGVFQVVADLVDLDGEFALIRGIAEASGRPLSITTLQRPGVPPDEYRRLLGLIETAVADGLEVRGQVAPRPVGLLLGLEGRMHPLVGSTTYERLAHLPLAERLRALREPGTREVVLEEVASLPEGGLLDRFPAVFRLTDPPRYDPAPEESLVAEARRRGTSPLSLAYDHLLEGDGRGMLYVPVTNYERGDLGAVREMLVHPLTVPGLGDAGAHCTMICDASFPTYLLAHWGLGGAGAGGLPVEWIVKQQAADTAALVGLNDRGVLAPGLLGDVNLIDPETLGLATPEMRTDLPAGGKRLVQPAIGYRMTIKAGEVIAENGELTGAFAGQLVRGAR